MAYFKPSIDAAGIHIPTYDDILEELMTNYRSIFGEDVYLGEDSKDYQMLSIFAKAMDDYAALAVDAYNSRNPNYATGDALDTLCPFVGITRKAAEQATAVLTITGDNGTVIPAGSQAIDTEDRTWTITEDYEIGVSTTCNATCDTAGKVYLGSDTINQIYTPVIGWTGVTNSTTGYRGRDQETDAELRIRFKNAVSSRATSTDVELYTALMGIENVTKVLLHINNSDDTDAQSVPGHSICAVVYNGADQTIAETIFAIKAPGINTYGSVSKTVVDAFGNLNTVKFSRPVAQNTAMYVSLTVPSSMTQDEKDQIESIIIRSVMEYANDLNIGETMYMNRIYGILYANIPNKDVEFTDVHAVANTTTYTTKFDPGWNGKIIVASESSVTVTFST